VQYSEEGCDKSFEHAFIMEFSTEADREYYLTTDPKHSAFKEELRISVVEDVLVFDFVPGMF